MKNAGILFSLTCLRQRNNLPTDRVSVAVLHVVVGDLAHIPRPGIPSAHKDEGYNRAIGNEVLLTHSASSLTRALVMTSVVIRRVHDSVRF